MTGPTPEPITPDQPLSLQDQILNHVSSLETLIKQHNEKSGALITPIRLTFGEEVDGDKGKDKEKGVVEVDDDLKKPYKEVLESPFTRRIIEFSALSHRMPTNLRIYDVSTDPDDHISCFVGAANQGEWEMPVWCRMFQQTLDGPARGWFDRMPNGCIDNWVNLRERFVERFALRRRCSKDPTEVTKIVQRANETLPNFKERWTEEMGYIQGVPEVMQISAFMSNSKFPELARRFTDQVPQTATEMMKRVNDFVKFKEAFRSTELHGGSKQKGDMRRRIGDSDPLMRCKVEGFENRRQKVNQLSLESLVKRPKEILATELQLQLPPPPPLLEIALESGKLNHLVKDVRQRAGNRGRQVRNNSSNGKIINMVYETGDNRKLKCQRRLEEDWTSTPITFPSISPDDVSDEPLIIEAEVEGYLSDHPSPFSTDIYKIGRIFGGAIIANRKDQLGSRV
ncbi:reverse transcriptase domain-containing protein [Tanacetum coccineum]